MARSACAAFGGCCSARTSWFPCVLLCVLLGLVSLLCVGRPCAQLPPTHPAKTDIPKGSTAEKKDARPGDAIVGMVDHVPYPTWVEKGTVRGIHVRKYGAVWVEHLGGTILYEVPRHLLFPTREEPQRYQEEARPGNKNPKPPAPANEEIDHPNPNPTTEPTSPANPPSGPTKTRDPITGSHAV